MSVINAKLLTAMLALGLLCLEQPASAQSNCKEAKGNLDEVFLLGGNSTSGTLSNAGWLNGTTLVVFTGAASNPLPSIVVFAGQFTITTGQGQLKASNVYLLDVATLQGNVLGNIDPNGSTGIFAGATGTLFLNTTKVNVAGNPQTFHSEVNGQVCFAR
jgi:hypothetical protein